MINNDLPVQFDMHGNLKLDTKFVDWATGDDTGVSSIAIFRHMLGLQPNEWGLMAPSDKWDRGRCIRMLNLFPEWWDRLDEMDISAEWHAQIILMRGERSV